MAKARVLAVDDQRYFRELIEGLLSDEGYEVQTASSGEEALHILEREDFEIVITDLVMPGLDGSQLVQRIKERLPEQEIVMVTGVVDVKTAVEAMKQGATDYILKPFDRNILLGSLDKILQRRRLRDEHAQLMAENLEYMGVLSLYERVTGLFSTLALGPLAERLIEGLCLETGAQAGILWMTQDLDEERLKLASARGLIRFDEEAEELDVRGLAPSLRESLQAGHSSVLPLAGGSAGEALWVPLRHSGALLGVARLSDKLDGNPFETADRASAEKFVGLGAAAVVNALRFRALERRSFRDPTTRAYTHAYFEDVVRNEIQKANRFGHRFSLIRFDLSGVGELRRELSEARFDEWLAGMVKQVGGVLRSTDLLASESEASYRILLPETDALGAAVLKQRIRESLEGGTDVPAEAGSLALDPTLASATYPIDGTQLDALTEALRRRVDENRSSSLGGFALGECPFAELLEGLLERAEPEPRETPREITRFMLDELARRPRDRGLLFVCPGEQGMQDLLAGMARLEGSAPQTELVVVAPPADAVESELPVTWVPPARVGTDRPFLLYYGDGPAYAMATDRVAEGGGLRLFHSSDRVLVEHLVFQLQRDLGVPMSA